MPNVLRMSGDLVPRWIPRQGFYAQGWPADLPWRARWRSAWLECRLRLRLARVGFWRGLHGTGVIAVGRLYASVIRGNGTIEHLGLLSTRVVTDAGVTFLRDDWNSGSNDINLMNFHACGTGTGAEAVGDTGMGTESTTALNPDSVRATGTRSVPASNQFRSVGTVTFDASAAITEHGLMSTSATGTGTLWDRSVFSAINVVSADSIQFTYTVTLSSGG